MQRMTGLFLCVCLLIGLTAARGWAIDPLLQRVQQQLSHLGYDPGMVDGVFGPRTRQALEDFQRAQHLPVTGTIDTRTLQALDRATLPSVGATPSTPPPELAPLRIVLDYLRFYADQPARVLPHVTEHFRGGAAPQLWLEQTLEELKAQGYTYLSWQVQHLELRPTEATVLVRTRVRVQGQELLRQEVFTLIRAAEGGWLLDDWRVEALPPEEGATQSGS